ncbi:MAG TPA: LptF/LptG family permease [Flavipsychrobacter sp.]|nr:LptF/LptG family permease [Flavipsychrobacter sp.]
MIKKLDILIVRSFIGPFIVTFFVSLFVLVMQFFWLYMDELIGKGLGIWMILQLLFYMSSTMVPMALPLGILLGSIMTFGNMGEHFELIAIKAAGISLLRFMRPLLVVIIFIGGFAFFFSNNVIPVANLKALSLLYDLRNSKPTLNIRPGLFNNDIEGFSIRVGEKSKDGFSIKNVMVYDHTKGFGNQNVVLANSGKMIPSKQALIFRLQDGWRYEEGGNNVNDKGRTQVRMHFKRWDKVFDLSGFKLTRTDENLFKGAYQMMNLSQLNHEIDSNKRYSNRLEQNISSYLNPYVSLAMPSKERDTLIRKINTPASDTRSYKESFIELIPDSLRSTLMEAALNQVRNSKGLVNISATEKRIQTENVLKYKIEWHRKFTLSFACVLLFLIGAPLGSIIRKGGLGLPLIIAVSFFLLFHIISLTGEKLAKSNSVVPWVGMWMATAMLLPIAFFLINKAKKDAQVLNKDWYINIGKRINAMFSKTKANGAS